MGKNSHFLNALIERFSLSHFLLDKHFDKNFFYAEEFFMPFISAIFSSYHSFSIASLTSTNPKNSANFSRALDGDERQDGCSISFTNQQATNEQHYYSKIVCWRNLSV